ncbi:MAG: hypothetical protein II180_14725 [Proteobacteria bacterium]|nr:hypothetical protein [Pseudomonadota bacterium]
MRKRTLNILALTMATALCACSSESEKTPGCADNKVLCGNSCCEHTCIDGACIDTKTDHDNCGEAGHACEADESCVDGECKKPDATCEAPKVMCGNDCTDLQSDPEHCGSCENACPDNEGCEAGECEKKCAENLILTEDGACADPMTDSAHCGENNIACSGNRICEAGVCICPDNYYDCDDDVSNGCESIKICDASKCLAGLEECGDRCVDLQNDDAHCGKCETKCADNMKCISGNCEEITADTCEAPSEICFGKCTDITSDDANCGKCLNACSKSEKCIEGICERQCYGTTRCGDACVDISSDDANCGKCGNQCQIGQKCDTGNCTCDDTHFDCDGNWENGCESTEKCACNPGEKRACWRGESENRNKGICKDGEQVCDETGQFWGECTGGVYPSAITCDEAGFYLGGDQNCNDIPDNQEACLSKCDAMISEKSYIGCEYWPIFLQNYQRYCESYPYTRYDLTLVMSNPNDSEATVYIFDKASYDASNTSSIKPYRELKIAPNDILIHTLVGKQYDKAQSANNFNYASDDIEKYMLYHTMQSPLAFKLRSSLPIIVYQFNPFAKPEGHSADASLLMPQNALGNEYMTMGFTSHGGDVHADVFSIVATEPGDTKVDITVAAAMLAGKNTSTGETIAAMKAGEKRTFTLKQFDALSLMQSGAAESTGSHVKADKKIEVFGGAACSNIPIGYGACDHNEEHILPLQAWGMNYAAVRTKPQKDEPNIYYILAQSDNTTVTLNGPTGDANTNTSFTLNAGKFKRVDSKNSFDVTSDKPIYVGQFLVGINYSNATRGDPSFISAVPREQYRTEYTFAVPPGYDADFVTIISPKDNNIIYTGDGHITNGKPTPFQNKPVTELPPEVFSGFASFGNQGYVYGYLDLDGGKHKLVADKPFGLIGYGFYQRTSYGYPVGLDLKEINKTN